MGRAARFGLLAVICLPLINEGEAPRLAIREQPPLSKPVIPLQF